MQQVSNSVMDDLFRELNWLRYHEHDLLLLLWMPKQPLQLLSCELVGVNGLRVYWCCGVVRVLDLGRGFDSTRRVRVRHGKEGLLRVRT